MEQLICKNRVKPKLLRERKTEALLVFIRTTLEEFFNKYTEESFQLLIENKEDTKKLFNSLNKLLNDLQIYVVNSSYLNTIIYNLHKNPSFKILAKKEEALMVYYDSLVKAIDIKLNKGTFWIPELVVICLLSEWLIEEEKSTYLYPFLNEIDYLDLLNIYDNIRINSKDEKKLIIQDMYKISSYLIERLKSSNYKISTNKRKRKK